MIRSLVVATIFVAAAGAPVFAESHLDKATAAHAAGKFEVALDELEAAYAENPKPEYLYAIGQVQAKLGHCRQAIQAYEMFRATVDDKDTKLVVQQAIDACKPAKAKAKATDAIEPKPADDAQQEEPPPEPLPPPKIRPFYKDTLGDALVGAGVAAGVAGLAFYMRARNELDAAEGSPTIETYLDHVTAARDARTIAVIAGVAGGIFLTGGVLRYALHEETYSVAVAPAADGNGGSVSLGGRF